MGVVTELPGHVEVLAEAPVVVAGRARRLGHLAGPLPVVPVVVGEVAFDLLRGRGGAAEEATRKAEVLGVNAWSFPVPPPERRPYPDAAGLATEPRHGGRAMAR